MDFNKGILLVSPRAFYANRISLNWHLDWDWDWDWDRLKQVFLLGKREAPQHFRVVESNEVQFSKECEVHLEESILSCSRQKAALLVLPKLMTSPKVQQVLEAILKKCVNGFPILVAGGSFHVEGKNGDFYNRLPIYANRPHGYQKIFHHDKFERFETDELFEPCKLGGGLSFLVTSIGVLAFGICKDWFVLRSAGEAKALDQINHALPVIAIAPALTNSVHDLESLFGTFRETRTIFMFANACGPVCSLLRKGKNCGQSDCGEHAHDVRSFIALPKQHFEVVEPSDGLDVKKNRGALVCKTPCNHCEHGQNVVVVRVGIKEERLSPLDS